MCFCLAAGCFLVAKWTCGFSSQVFMTVKLFTEQNSGRLSPASLQLPTHVSLTPHSTHHYISPLCTHTHAHTHTHTHTHTPTLRYMQEDGLTQYAPYFKNSQAQEAIMKEAGAKFFADTQLRLQDPFTLFSYLVKPFERMARYQLFIVVRQ